jgi:polyhydroxyalkanoate synthesis regulator phasin
MVGMDGAREACRREKPMETDTVPPGGAADSSADQEPRSSVERLVLAGVGAIATAVDMADERFVQYVERGQQVREELQDRRASVRRERWASRERARDYFRGMMDLVLDTFNVPSRTDVDTINVKLNILTRKLDDLQQASETPAPEPPIKGDSKS